jgi:hypothetical protein
MIDAEVVQPGAVLPESVGVVGVVHRAFAVPEEQQDA